MINPTITELLREADVVLKRNEKDVEDIENHWIEEVAAIVKECTTFIEQLEELNPVDPTYPRIDVTMLLHSLRSHRIVTMSNAILKGYPLEDIDPLLDILKQENALNDTNSDGATLLHKMLNYENRDVIMAKKLLDLGADPGLRGFFGTTPLHVMLYSYEHSWKAEKGENFSLLEKMIDINPKSLESQESDHGPLPGTMNQPLHTAANLKSLPLFVFLVSKGAKLNGDTNRQGFTSLQLLQKIYPAITEEEISDIVKEKKAASQVTTTKKLLEQAYAALKKDGSCIPYDENKWIQEIACRIERLNSLITRLEQLNSVNTTYPRTEVTVLLRSLRSHRISTMTYTTKYSDHIEKIVLLLEMLKQESALNDKDSNGSTLLHDAIQKRAVNLAWNLLALGADPSVKNRFGTTPLHTALSHYLPSVGNSPYWKVKEKQHFGLLAHMIEVNSDSLESQEGGTDCNGDTLLHTAARTESVDLFSFLLSKGARTDLDKSPTALQTALQNFQRYLQEQHPAIPEEKISNMVKAERESALSQNAHPDKPSTQNLSLRMR